MLEISAGSISPQSIAGWVLIYALVLFIIGYLSMYLDKRRAVCNQWRISESTLLLWAFLGGAFGAKLAQKLFRHKTRKEPFRTALNFFAVWNVLLFGLLFFVLPTQTVMLEKAFNSVFQDGPNQQRPKQVKVNRGL